MLLLLRDTVLVIRLVFYVLVLAQAAAFTSQSHTVVQTVARNNDSKPTLIQPWQNRFKRFYSLPDGN